MDQVEEVKQKVDIVGLISEYVPLKRAGRNMKGLCPFHGEKTPSFVVNPELSIFKCFGCFPAGSLIKTPFGLHRIEDVVEGELVESGEGNARRVLVTHRRNYGGELVTVTPWKLNERVDLTADHQVYTLGGAPYTRKYKYFSRRYNQLRQYPVEEFLGKLHKCFPVVKERAGNLVAGQVVLYPINQLEQDTEEIDLSRYITKKWPKHGTKPKKVPSIVKVDAYLLKLIGYYVAEGSNNRAYIRFSLGNHERAFALEILRLVKKVFGIGGEIHSRNSVGKTGLEVSCCNSVLANIFENLCGRHASHKHIPFEFQWLSVGKQRVLAEAIYKGDGYSRPFRKSVNRFKVITTTSRVLAEQLRDIVLRMGFFPTVSMERAKVDKNGTNHKETFKVQWSHFSRYDLVYEKLDGQKYWILPIRLVSKRGFRGEVFNLTVEEDHSYVANVFAVANCGEGGDVYSFLQKMEGMEFGEALSALAKRVGVELKSYKPTVGEEARERLIKINSLAAEAYHFVLTKHKAGEGALKYLKGRGVGAEAMEKFKIGYAPEGWDFITTLLGKKKGYKLEDLERAGVVVGGGKIYDRFRGRIMFPLNNHRGQTVGFAGRILPGADEKAGGKYINTPETEVYHKGDLLYGLDVTRGEVKQLGWVVVVEGEIDMIASWQAGVRNVVAIKGSAFTEAQVERLRRLCDTAVLAMDVDVAGDAAARRGIETAEARGLMVKVARWEGAKDPGELAVESREEWKRIVAGAIPIYDFYLESAVARYGLGVEGKRKIGQELLPVWAAISDEIVKAHYMQKLAATLGVGEEDVRRQMHRSQEQGFRIQGAESRGQSPGGRVQGAGGQRSRREVVEEYVVGLAVQAGRVERLTDSPVRQLVKDGFWMRVVAEWVGCREDGVGELVGKLPEELREKVQNLVMDPIFTREDGDGVEEWEKEWRKAVRELEEVGVRERIEDLRRMGGGKAEEIVELTRRLAELTREK